MNKNKIDLIRQALAAAETSVRSAKQLLSELEMGNGDSITSQREKPKELPGTVGIFDGENMAGESGESFPVPANYASKSLLVVGDTLKLVEEGKEKRFKQIEHVKRHKTLGILAKKDGKWKAVTPEGSYKVLPAAVAHFGGDVGSEVVLHLPMGNLTVPWGAIESVKNVKPSADEIERVETPSEETPKPEVRKEEPKKEAPKEEKEVKKEVKPGSRSQEEKPEKKPASTTLPPVGQGEEAPKEVKVDHEKPAAPVEKKPEPKTVVAAPVLEVPELEAPKPVIVEQKPTPVEIPLPEPVASIPEKVALEEKAPIVVTEEDELT